MKYVSFFVLAFLLLSCGEQKAPANSAVTLNKLAEDYVRLGLYIGQYDGAFVDAYYGPDSLKPSGAKDSVFPKDSLLTAVKNMMDSFSQFASNEKNDTLKKRAEWINGQLVAFARRIKIFSGEFASFDEESKELFGVQAPTYAETHYQQLVSQLDSLLPGSGDRNARFQALANKFIIPKSKLDTVFKAAIAECRQRTLQHYQLPANEDFKLEFVNNQPWNGYNWYKGNFQSLIQINTDLNIFIERAIDVGSHESYPGHHVYNMLLEKNLYRDKGWVEISLYPLFSPQSFIAEGSANYGIELAFPGEEKIVFAKQLLRLAGLDTAGTTRYFQALAIKGKLNYARNEAARGIINGTMTEKEALRWLMEYALFNQESAAKSISFIKANRSYVINYNYGMDMVKSYIESNSTAGKRWELFGWLLSNPVSPKDLAQ